MPETQVYGNASQRGLGEEEEKAARKQEMKDLLAAIENSKKDRNNSLRIIYHI